MKISELSELVERKVREVLGAQHVGEQADNPVGAVPDYRKEIVAQIEAEHATFQEKAAAASQEVEKARSSWEAAEKQKDKTFAEFALASQSMRSIENAHDAAIERFQRKLIETADPRIDEVIRLLREEIQKICNPLTTPIVGLVPNEWGGYDADQEGRKNILARLQHCREAVRQAEAMKLDVRLDLDALNRLLVGGE